VVKRDRLGSTARKVWACSSCGSQSPPVRSKSKAARKCPHCPTGAVRAFASTREYRWLLDLLLLQKAAKIVNLQVQPAFPLVINGVEVGKYTADFAYTADGSRKVIDVKGYMTEETAFRIKVAEAVHNMHVEIVK
jgi:hypothetical protein